MSDVNIKPKVNDLKKIRGHYYDSKNFKLESIYRKEADLLLDSYVSESHNNYILWYSLTIHFNYE